MHAGRKGVMKMSTKQKSSAELREELDAVEIKCTQAEHQLQRIENREAYFKKGERKARTHRLCQMAGAIEGMAPETKQLTCPEFAALMERIVCLPEWQRQLDWVLAHRGEEELYSTLSLPCDADQTE